MDKGAIVHVCVDAGGTMHVFKEASDRRLLLRGTLHAWRHAVAFRIQVLDWGSQPWEMEKFGARPILLCWVGVWIWWFRLLWIAAFALDLKILTLVLRRFVRC